MLAVISLLVVLAISFLVTRIASSALMHTGLSRDVARFQARSALTGAGFTTSESERLVNHPVRRRILMVLMLVGNAGIITAVSSLLLAFIGSDQESPLWLRVGLLVTGLISLWTVANSHFVDRHLSRWIDRLLKRYTQIEVRDFASLLGLSGDYRIVEWAVGPDDWLAGRTLAQSALAEEGLLVLAVQRKGGTFRGTPSGEIEIESHDTLVIYGHVDTLEQLDTRRRGPGGELDHLEAVAEGERRRRLEAERDSKRTRDAADEADDES